MGSSSSSSSSLGGAATAGGGGGGGGGAAEASGGGGGAAEASGGGDVRGAVRAFDAVGGGGRLRDGGSLLEGSTSAWATLGGLVERGVATWRFSVESDALSFGLISGAAPVPDGWGYQHACAYEIVNQSNGWVNVLGTTVFSTPLHYHMAPRGSVVRCSLDMDARTLAFTVNDSAPPCVAFTDIVGPVRPIVWRGSAKLLDAGAGGGSSGPPPARPIGGGDGALVAHTDAVGVPAVFDAAGGGGRLVEDGSALEGSGRAWATLGLLVARGSLTWRFRVDCDHMAHGLITGDEPVPADWRGGNNARGYEIVNTSNGWVNARGLTKFGAPANWRMAPRGSEVECFLDMNARTMSFTVNDSAPPCVAFRDIVGPVRPIMWGGNIKLLRVWAAGAASGVRMPARNMPWSFGFSAAVMCAASCV
jgi:hypothetical protein